MTIFELGKICFDIDLLLEGDFLIIFILNLSYMDMTSDHFLISIMFYASKGYKVPFPFSTIYSESNVHRNSMKYLMKKLIIDLKFLKSNHFHFFFFLKIT